MSDTNHTSHQNSNFRRISQARQHRILSQFPNEVTEMIVAFVYEASTFARVSRCIKNEQDARYTSANRSALETSYYEYGTGSNATQWMSAVMRNDTYELSIQTRTLFITHNDIRWLNEIGPSWREQVTVLKWSIEGDYPPQFNQSLLPFFPRLQSVVVGCQLCVQKKPSALRDIWQDSSNMEAKGIARIAICKYRNDAKYNRDTSLIEACYSYPNPFLNNRLLEVTLECWFVDAESLTWQIPTVGITMRIDLRTMDVTTTAGKELSLFTAMLHASSIKQYESCSCSRNANYKTVIRERRYPVTQPEWAHGKDSKDSTKGFEIRLKVLRSLMNFMDNDGTNPPWDS